MERNCVTTVDYRVTLYVIPQLLGCKPFANGIPLGKTVSMWRESFISPSVGGLMRTQHPENHFSIRIPMASGLMFDLIYPSN